MGRLLRETRRVLQHRAAGYPLGPEKRSAIAAIDRAIHLLGRDDVNPLPQEVDRDSAFALPVGAAEVVLRKVARHETIGSELLRSFARSVHDLRLTELASQVLAARSDSLRLTFAVRLAEAVWAVSHAGSAFATPETAGSAARAGARRDP